MAAAILNFLLPVTCSDVGIASVEKFDPENGGVAVGIFVLSPTEAEIPLGGNLPPHWHLTCVKYSGIMRVNGWIN